MRIVEFHEARIQLSRLIDQAIKGEPFIIAKAGKPLVRVTAIDASPAPRRKRLGFMKGLIAVPDDFDTMHSSEVAKLFQGES